MENEAGFTFFDTDLGRMGIAWNERGIASVRMADEGDPRLLARSPGARESEPPVEIREAMEGIRALGAGELRDLRELRLDEAGIPAFHRRVYEAARCIPIGRTTSYGELAARIGAPGAARAVGQALARNPFLLVVPCHRILSSDGRLGGFSARGGTATKLRLLSLERAAASRSELAYDLDAALAHLGRDPGMAALIEAMGPPHPRLEAADDVFDALAHAIIRQQLSGRAASAIHARLAALFPHGHLGLDARRFLRVSTERLRAVGLSRPKIEALRDLARKVVEGALPTFEEMRGMDDEAIVERLTTVRGVGRWTAEMLLIFRLGRPDVWPVDDLGVRKGYQAAFGLEALPTPAELEASGERFRPFRSAAALLLWRAADMQKTLRAA